MSQKSIYFCSVKSKMIIMIRVIEGNLNNRQHQKAVIDLLNHYMSDRMGGNLPPYSRNTATKVIKGLHEHPSILILLAMKKEEYVGLMISFINFATFTAKSFINIHDIVVLDRYRGTGIGRKLMEAIDTKARELDCGKITLEVREDNHTAQMLYRSLGYDEENPVMHFWIKYF